MSNPWVKHVKDYAEKNNLSYMCAMSTPACKASYVKPTPVKKSKTTVAKPTTVPKINKTNKINKPNIESLFIPPRNLEYKKFDDKRTILEWYAYPTMIKGQKKIMINFQPRPYGSRRENNMFFTYSKTNDEILKDIKKYYNENKKNYDILPFNELKIIQMLPEQFIRI